MKTTLLCSTLALLTLSGAPAARACSCATQDVCLAFWDADAVFIGRAAVTELGIGAQRTNLTVERWFRGPRSRRIEVVSRGIGGSCDLGFTNGTRYLVYARRDGNAWKVTFCSRTAPVAEAANDLTYIKTVASDRSQGGRIIGYLRSPDPNAQPFAGATVTLEGNGRRRVARTDSSGRYEFRPVPPGRYRLGARLPPAFVPVASDRIEVKGPGACVIHEFAPLRRR